MIIPQGTSVKIYMRADGTYNSGEIGKSTGQAGIAGTVNSLGGNLYEVILAVGDTDTIGPMSIILLDNLSTIIGIWYGVVLAAYPSTGDPMAASVPGTYSPGQAGFEIGSALAALSGVLPATANAAIGVEVLDKANGIEIGLTVRQALRLIAASLTGKLAIVGSTVTIKGAGVNTDRVAATTDAIGQRTAVTLTP